MSLKIRGLGWLALLGIVIASAWHSPASGIDPPTGISFRDPFISRDGAVTDSFVVAPESLVFRPSFLRRDSGGIHVIREDLEAPEGISFRPRFLERSLDGIAVTEEYLDPPHGIVFRPLFLERTADGPVVIEEYLDPPTGIVFRDLQFHREWGAMTPVPAATPTRLLAQGSVVPNPFNPGTQISFRLHREAEVIVRVLDARGRRVRTLHAGTLPPDLHVLQWDGCDDRGAGVASGSYLFRVEAGAEVLRLKGALVK